MFLFGKDKYFYLKSMNVLKVDNLTKTYRSGNRELTVLDQVNFEVAFGDTLSIVGPSGSGKTTLLGLCAGLDVASSGSVLLDGRPLEKMTEDQRAAVRNQLVGFIFQNFQLLQTLTALENVMVPLELKKRKDAKNKAMELLDKVGLADRVTHYPNQLSGESSSVFPSHVLLPTNLKSCLQMSPLEIWIPKQEKWSRILFLN